MAQYTNLEDVSDSEEAPTAAQAAFAEAIPHLAGTESAQAVSLASTLTVFTLPGVLVVNTTLPEVLQSFRTVATITTVECARVEFTVRASRPYRLLVVEQAPLTC